MGFAEFRLRLAKVIAGNDYEVVSSLDWYQARGRLFAAERIVSGDNETPVISQVEHDSAVRGAAKQIFDVLKRDTTNTAPAYPLNDLANRAGCDLNTAFEALGYLGKTCPDAIFESDGRNGYRMKVRSSQSKVIDQIVSSKTLGGSA